jgi:MFS family permease
LSINNQVRAPGFYLFLLLAAIFLDEILNNYFLGIFNNRPIHQKAIFFGAFLFLQIIAAPLQAGFSDFYCRKKSLIASLGISALSLIFVFFYFNDFFLQLIALSIATLLKSTLGNTLPLAWAGIADIKNQNYRFSLGLSTSIIALGYLSLLLIDAIFKEQQAAFVIFLFFICLIPLFWRKFFDLVDRRHQRELFINEHGLEIDNHDHKVKHFFSFFLLDIKSLWNNFLMHKRFCIGLLGVFLPVEISYYSTHALGVDLAVQEFEVVTILMIIGYLCGVLALKYCISIPDQKMIKMGYNISIISFSPMFLLIPFLAKDQVIWVIAPCYFFYSFGVAFIVPSLFSTLSKERKPHEQGKIYGLIDSTDTVALLFALIIGLIYNLFLTTYYIIYFSFILFLVSRIYYEKFEKTTSESP